MRKIITLGVLTILFGLGTAAIAHEGSDSDDRSDLQVTRQASNDDRSERLGHYERGHRSSERRDHYERGHRSGERRDHYERGHRSGERHREGRERQHESRESHEARERSDHR